MAQGVCSYSRGVEQIDCCDTREIGVHSMLNMIRLRALIPCTFTIVLPR